MSSARAEILDRIRQALGTALSPADTPQIAQAHAKLSRDYQRSHTLGDTPTLDLLKDRLLDYDADVVELGSRAEIASAVASALAARGERSLMAAPQLPDDWLPEGVVVARDDELSLAELESHPAVITSCEIAVAATGTLVLVHRGAQGRRVLTLLPDHHILVLRRDQVVETIPEAWERLAGVAGLPITTVSGPSATSDIEMTRVRGVHGPRHLTVLLYS